MLAPLGLEPRCRAGQRSRRQEGLACIRDDLEQGWASCWCDWGGARHVPGQAELLPRCLEPSDHDNLLVQGVALGLVVVWDGTGCLQGHWVLGAGRGTGCWQGHCVLAVRGTGFWQGHWPWRSWGCHRHCFLAL